MHILGPSCERVQKWGWPKKPLNQERAVRNPMDMDVKFNCKGSKGRVRDGHREEKYENDMQADSATEKHIAQDVGKESDREPDSYVPPVSVKYLNESFKQP